MCPFVARSGGSQLLQEKMSICTALELPRTICRLSKVPPGTRGTALASAEQCVPEASSGGLLYTSHTALDSTSGNPDGPLKVWLGSRQPIFKVWPLLGRLAPRCGTDSCDYLT